MAKDYSRAINAAFAPLSSEYAYPYLGRSLYDISIASVISALALQDESPPLLTANALRGELAVHAGNLATQWQICVDFTEKVCKAAAEDPDTFARAVVDATRNTPQYDESRKTAQGMVLFGGEYAYSVASKAAVNYGLFWAFEKNQDEGADTSNKLVCSFGARNVFNLDMRGDWGAERVHPALIPNSALETAIVSYDMRPNERGNNFISRNVILEPDTTSEGQVLIKEHVAIRAGVDIGNQLLTARAKDFETVGSIQLGPEGSVLVNSSNYYVETISTMLEGDK